ncbi:two-component system, sporulation sensor kinase B [Fictibacillus solisalsi]|uniref:histidine kinase n=1 Tax=Fictibacillus solisalsi TaxID=459525 RepID=A0A1H0A9Z8_9BACL|nr:ATP-binding protein [Fictibacillus solisalsi]SDN30074.1 two-component system, sporulation sensor kinase B [Fictibacillus solisalsi]
MLTEKLLLHVLMVLAPVLSYGFFFERKYFSSFPYLWGALQSICAAFCIIFAYHDGGLFWDLRYAPLILAFLYGGKISGGMVLGTILVCRAAYGGEALVFALLGIVLAALIPFLLSGIFMDYHPYKRVKMAMITGIWPIVVQIFILLSFTAYSSEINSSLMDTIFRLLTFGIIQVLGIGTAARLNELIIERSLMKKEIQKAEKLNTMGELAASIAHEVRNPLTVVKGFLQLMQKDDKDQRHPYIPLVLSELGRAEVIINDYLNFAKPEFKQLEHFSLAQILSDVCVLLNALAVKQGVELKREGAAEALLLTDRNQLRQALVNVIKNAIEATPSGGTVTVSLSLSGDQAVVSIADTGKGMTPEQLSRIGTLFYTTKDKGTGLGTTVSVKIIESMQGKISFKSEPGKGTEVTLKLPLHKKMNISY